MRWNGAREAIIRVETLSSCSFSGAKHGVDDDKTDVILPSDQGKERICPNLLECVMEIAHKNLLECVMEIKSP